MNSRVIAALAAAAVIAVGTLGYVAGRSGSQPDASVIASVLDRIIPAAHAQDAPNSTPVPNTSFSDAQRGDIELIIRNYLMNNPEVIRDAVAELQRREDMAAKAGQSQVIADNASLLFNSPREVVLGNPKGDVTLVEFFDYNCGYCRRAHADMKQLIAEDPNLRVVLKEFPILGEGSVEAAQIAVALLLTAPEKYGEFHDLMLSEPGQVNGARAAAIAVDLGLNEDELRLKADSDEVKANITEVMGLAQKLDLTGTPSYVTRQKVVVGAVGYETLKQEVAEARAACKADAAAC